MHLLAFIPLLERIPQTKVCHVAVKQEQYESKP